MTGDYPRNDGKEEEVVEHGAEQGRAAAAVTGATVGRAPRSPVAKTPGILAHVRRRIHIAEWERNTSHTMSHFALSSYSTALYADLSVAWLMGANFQGTLKNIWKQSYPVLTCLILTFLSLATNGLGLFFLPFPSYRLFRVLWISGREGARCGGGFVFGN